MPVDWAALGVPHADILAPVHGAYVADNLRTVLYNTKLVPKAEAPRRYEDLLDPKWKGKIVAPNLPAHWAYPAVVLGEEKAKQLAKALVEKQALALVPTYTDVSARVANGEFPLGIGTRAGVERRHGAPVDNAPMEKVAFQNFTAVVLKGSAHPAAAQALAYFMAVTPEGKRVIDDVLVWSKHTTPGTESYEVNGQGKGILPPYEWFKNEEPRLSREFGNLLGNR